MAKTVTGMLKVACICTVLAGVCSAENTSSAPGAGADVVGTGRPRIIRSEQGSQQLQAAVYNSVGTTPISPADLRAASTAEVSGMEQTLQKYQSAFENLSLPQVREVWPTLDRRREGTFRDVFQTFRSTAWTRHLELQCAAPMVANERASLDCRETLAYGEAGSVLRHTGPVRVAILLKKQPSGWVLENMKRN